MEPIEATVRFLGEVRRACARVARAEVFYAGLVVLAVAGAFALAFAALAGVGPGRWGWAFGAIGLGIVCWVVWRLGIVPGRARRDDAELALWVEARVPALKSSLVTAVQTVRSGEAERLGYAPALALETTALAADGIRTVPPGALVDRTRLEKLRWSALGVVAGLTFVGLVAPGLYAAGLANLTTAPPPSHEGSDRLVDVAVSQLDIEVKPPPYTQLKPRKLPRSAGHVEALTGSEVSFSTTTLFPVRGAALVLESDPEARWMLTLEADGTLRGSFRVGQADRYQFVLLGQDGEVLRERIWREVRVKADASPEVLLLLPENDLEVKPNDQIGFFYEASDDLGIDRIEMVVTDAEGMELSRKVVAGPRGGRLEKGNATVEVGALKLEAGDAIDVFFEALDLNDVTGPGRGKSQARRLSLYSPEEEHDKLLQSLRKLIEDMLDVLADRLESPVDKERPDLVASFADLHLRISHATDTLLDSMEGLIQSLSTDPLAKDELRAAMREVRDRLLTLHQQEAAQLDKWVNDRDLVEPRVFTTLIAQGNEEAVSELEQGILRLKDLIDGAMKDAILEAGREMLETQNEMMELLKQLKENNDPAAREAVLKKLKKLQEKLKELQQKLARLQERSPYENQNPAQRTSERQQEAQDLESQMEKIQRLLEEGKIDEAMKMLEDLAKSTQEMMAGLQEDLEDVGSGGQSSAMRREMQELQQELEQLADGQRGVQRETEATEKAIEERQRQELMEQAKEQLDEMKAEAQKIREALEKADQPGLASEDKAALGELEKAAQKLEKAIEEARLSEAGQQAGQVSEGSGALQSEVDESARREVEEGRLGELKEAMKQLGEAKERAEKLAEKMAGLQPGQGGEGGPGESGMTPGEQKKMSELGESQRQLGERLKQVREKLSEMEGKMPGISEAMGEPLEQAGQSMGEAGEELSQERPEGAQQRQQEAIEKLQEAQKRLQERMGKQKNGGEGDQPGVNDPNEKVGIPDEDPNEKARKLRDEIIRAMKEKAPEQYKDVIKKFYEELTK